MKKDSSPIFPDVNVLIALGWLNHPFHAAARERMKENRGFWFTCAVTQLGFIRISSNPAVAKHIVSPAQAAELFLRMTDDPKHMYAADSASMVRTSALNVIGRAVGPNQITDAYLLSLAAEHGARFVTFDGRLSKLSEDVCEIEVLKA